MGAIQIIKKLVDGASGRGQNNAQVAEALTGEYAGFSASITRVDNGVDNNFQYRIQDGSNFVNITTDPVKHTPTAMSISVNGKSGRVPNFATPGVTVDDDIVAAMQKAFAPDKAAGKTAETVKLTSEEIANLRTLLKEAGMTSNVQVGRPPRTKIEPAAAVPSM